MYRCHAVHSDIVKPSCLHITPSGSKRAPEMCAPRPLPTWPSAAPLGSYIDPASFPRAGSRTMPGPRSISAAPSPSPRRRIRRPRPAVEISTAAAAAAAAAGLLVLLPLLVCPGRAYIGRPADAFSAVPSPLARMTPFRRPAGGAFEAFRTGPGLPTGPRPEGEGRGGGKDGSGSIPAVEGRVAAGGEGRADSDDVVPADEAAPRLVQAAPPPPGFYRPAPPFGGPARGGGGGVGCWRRCGCGGRAVSVLRRLRAGPDAASPPTWIEDAAHPPGESAGGVQALAPSPTIVGVCGGIDAPVPPPRDRILHRIRGGRHSPPLPAGVSGAVVLQRPTAVTPDQAHGPHWLPLHPASGRQRLSEFCGEPSVRVCCDSEPSPR